MLFSKGLDRLLAVFEQRLDKIEQNSAKTVAALMENNNALLNALLQGQDKILALSGDAILRLKTPEIAQAQNQNQKKEYEGPVAEIMKIPALSVVEEAQRQAAVNELNELMIGAKGTL